MNKRGQSIIEYSLIAVLVILGVVTMGPYVLRSIGAHFKLWDDGINDSFIENISQAPAGDVPAINSVCNCWYVNAGCGSNQAGSQCKPTESILNLNCSLDSIQGCDVGAALSMCQPDPVNCCTAWTNIRCGATPLSQATLPPNDCYVGYEIQGHQCGNTTTIQCVLASTLGLTCAPPACSGIISTTNTASGPVNTAAPCPNEPPVSAPLVATNNISYVADQAHCVSTQTCQVYCLPTYVLNSATPPTACIPPNIIPPTPTFQCFQNTGRGPQPPYTTPFLGNWTGFYDFNQHSGTNGDINLTIDCTSGSVDGTCFAGPVGYGGTGIGKRSCPGACQALTFYGQNGSNTTSFSWSIQCTGSGQIKDILDNSQNNSVTPAPTNGCNWSGTEDIMSLESGNDMYLTCDTSSGQGVLTQFVEAPRG